jgi:tyrosine-protein kinase Etk/Wzc
MAKLSKPRRFLRRATLPLSRASWLSARAKNALRRPIFIGAVSIGVFILALAALIAAPRQVEESKRGATTPVDPRADTIAAQQALDLAQVRLRATADSLNAARGAAAAAFRTVAVDTLSPGSVARRDSIAASMTTLATLVERAENAPLPQSYRALGESPPMAQDPRVRTLLDSLTAIEREREAFGASGGADPIFVALTSSANELGRTLLGLAQERRAALEREVKTLTPKIETIPSTLLAAADTVPRLAAYNAASAQVAQLTTRLAQTRQYAAAQHEREMHEQRSFDLRVPPVVLLAAALVLGAALGFGTAYFDELRHPRLADAAEAERVTGLRVLGSVVPRRVSPERSRRQVDREAPPYLDHLSDVYQLVWLHVTTASPGTMILTVTGDDPAVASIVASNLAAISADEARHTLVIDADAAACGVAAALQIRAEPGLVELIDGRARTGEAIETTTIGRSSLVDVIPSGIGVPLPDVTEVSAVLQRHSVRFARRYDTIIVVASQEHAMSGLPSSLPNHDVLYCTRVGHTRVAKLREAIAAVRRGGGHPLGLVVWDTLLPNLTTPKELASGPRPKRTTEMPAVAAKA